MENTTTEQYARVIIRGKEWMGKSLDPQHGATHAKTVAEVSIDIYDELYKQDYPGIKEINKDLVIIAAWWHDCFKATQQSFKGKNNMIEGKESVKIINKELSNSLSKADLRKLTDAVGHHSGLSVFRYLFIPGSFSPVYKVLMEADAYDTINVERFKISCQNVTLLSRKLWLLVDVFQTAILPVYLRTNTARKNLYSRLWTFWGVAFWKEWLLIKSILGVNKLEQPDS